MATEKDKARWKNLYPNEPEQYADLRKCIEQYTLPGYAPEKPFVPRSGKVIALGSCFAEHIYRALVRAQIGATHLSLSETLNTPPFALITMHYLAGHKDYAAMVGHLSPGVLNEEGLVEARAMLNDAALFILTLGVAAQPFHEDGRPTFYITARTIHGTNWRMLTVDEIVNYARSVIRVIRELRPGIPVVLTLSPIPVNNALTQPAAIVEDCVSKSRIRVAIDELMQERIDGVYYWPSFEVIRWIGSHVGPFFGSDGTDHRHIPVRIIDLITNLFIERYFEPASP